MGKGGASEATRRVGLCGRFLLSPPPPSRTPARMLSACTSPVLYDVLPDPARASRYDAIALNAGQRGPAGRGAVPGVPAPQSTSPCPRTALAASFASLSLTTPTAPQTRKSKRIDMVQPELPQELVDAIVDEIGDTLKGKARRLALAALVQTGWAFMRRAQLHQFHRIRLRGAERCAAWAAHFAETQRLGTYVHDLDVVGQGAAGKLDLSSWSEFPALLQACPNLDYLGMWRANVNRLPKPESFHRLVPSLRRLMLRDCFASYETLEGLLTTFPALQELKLGTMDMTGIHAPPAELPPLRLRRLTILSGLTIGGGGHAYGTRLGRSIGMLDELKMPFDYSEHFDFVRDLVQSLEEGPSTLRLTHSNRDSPPSASGKHIHSRPICPSFLTLSKISRR